MTTTTDPSTPSAKIPRERLEEVRECYLRGEQSLTIQEHCAKKWGITQRQVRTYLKLVREQLAKHATNDIEAVRQRSEQLLLETYASAKARKGHTKDGAAFSDPDHKTMAACAYRLGTVRRDGS